MGKTHIIAETGAGQHGVATATVCSLFDLKCTIFMGAKDARKQFSNVQRMKLLGADVVEVTEGDKTLCIFDFIWVGLSRNWSRTCIL